MVKSQKFTWLKWNYFLPKKAAKGKKRIVSTLFSHEVALQSTLSEVS